MALKILKHKKYRIWLIVLGTCIAVILILGLLVNLYWSPILAKKVKSVVLTSSDSLYTVDFSKAELHILRGTIVIYDISLKPDTAVYNRRKKQHLAPNNLVELHVKRLVLAHIHPFSLYFKQKLNIGEIILSAPVLNVSYQLNHTKDTTLKDNKTAWQKISKSLHSIHIGSIQLNDVQLRYKDYSGNKVAISELKEMNLSANDLLIDSATQTDRSRILYCKEIIAELKNYTGKTPSGLYTYKIKHLKLSTLTSQLNVEGLTLQPVNTAEFFNKSQNDKYTLNLDSLQLNHFDYLGYHKYRTFSASVMLIDKGALSLFNNPNRTGNPKADKIVGFPTFALNALTTDLKIDTILVKHLNIAYSEFNKKSNQTGTLQFNNTNGQFLNVTNNKTALQKNNIAMVELSSYFMNRAKLNVLFTFNLTAKDEAFSYKGSLGPMDMQAINSATMPLAMVKITSGTLRQLNFDIHANRSAADGSFLILYNDVKVKLLKPDTTYNGFKQRLIESLYANLFIIKHSNPDKDGEPARTFNVHYLRPKNAAFFNSIWQTLLSGIKPSVGLDEKTQKATEAQMSQHQINKQNRIKKRALRTQRRAAKQQQKQMEKQQKTSN
jgi:hypothetical protein